MNEDGILLENETLINYSNSSKNEIFNISNVFKIIYSQGINFHSSLKKTINNFFDESKVFEAKSLMGQNLNFFYQSILILLNNLNEMFQKLKLILIEPLEEYKVKLNNFNNSIISDYNLLVKKYYNSKEKVIKTQRQFYHSIIAYNKAKQEFNEKKKEYYNNYLMKLKSEQNNFKQIYKYQILSTNKSYFYYNNIYKQLMKKLNENEENRLNFLKTNLEMFCHETELISNKTDLFIKEFITKLSSWTMEREKKIFNEEFIFSNNDKRFLNEEFLIYSKDNITKLNIQIANNNQNIQKKNTTSKGRVQFINFSYIENDEDIYDLTSFHNIDYQKMVSHQLMKFIDSSDEIPYELISVCNTLISELSEFSKVVIKQYLDSHSNGYNRLKNYNNILHFSHLLSNILLNSHLDNETLTNIKMAIIFISQKTYVVYENKKIFLSGIISKHEIFKSPFFWNNIIEFKLKLKLNNVVKETVKKFNLELLNTNNNQENKNSKNLLLNMFHKTNSKEKKNYTNEFANLVKFDLYDKLSRDTNKFFLDSSFEQFHLILKEYIPCFINFNFGIDKSINFIVDLCNKYNINNEWINYYIVRLNSSSYSIMQYGRNLIQDLKIKNKIEDIKKGKFDSILERYSIKKHMELYKLEDKIMILSNISNFLNNHNKMNFLYLNKDINHKLTKKIYKNLLQNLSCNTNYKNNISQFKLRISIWKILLKVKEIKAKYPYIPNKDKAIAIPIIKYDNSNISIIDLDCQRTFFENDIEEYQQKINNILKTIAMLIPDINYCQGFNFISAFLIKITNNEEESFYIMMGLILNTNFKVIFYNDLSKLEIYFSVFERLLSLFLPELSNCFKIHSILTNFYASPWFITLFTSTINKNSKLEVIIKIFDNFILSGWKTIYNTSLKLLESREQLILTMKSENILHYITSDLIKDELYGEESEKFINKISEPSIIKKKLIHNIKNEIKTDKEYKKVSESNNSFRNNIK